MRRSARSGRSSEAWQERNGVLSTRGRQSIDALSRPASRRVVGCRWRTETCRVARICRTCTRPVSPQLGQKPPEPCCARNEWPLSWLRCSVTLRLARVIGLPHERRPRFQSGRFGLDSVTRGSSQDDCLTALSRRSRRKIRSPRDERLLFPSADAGRSFGNDRVAERLCENPGDRESF